MDDGLYKVYVWVWLLFCLNYEQIRIKAIYLGAAVTLEALYYSRIIHNLRLIEYYEYYIFKLFSRNIKQSN